MISDKIKKWRKARNLTQKSLAELACISESAIKQYEGGKRQPRIEQLRLIAGALDVPVSELLSTNIIQNAESLIGFIKESDPELEVDDSVYNFQIEDEPFNQIRIAEDEADRVFLEHTRSISDALLKDLYMEYFLYLSRLGKFEALRRLDDVLAINKYKKSSGNPKSRRKKSVEIGDSDPDQLDT